MTWAAVAAQERAAAQYRKRLSSAQSGTFYLMVVKGVLVRREKTTPELAAEIAMRLDGRSQDVRDAVRVARLAPSLGVERAISLLLPGG